MFQDETGQFLYTMAAHARRPCCGYLVDKLLVLVYDSQLWLPLLKAARQVSNAIRNHKRVPFGSIQKRDSVFLSSFAMVADGLYLGFMLAPVMFAAPMFEAAMCMVKKLIADTSFGDKLAEVASERAGEGCLRVAAEVFMVFSMLLEPFIVVTIVVRVEMVEMHK